MRKQLAAMFSLLIIWQIIGVSSWFELSRRAIRKEIKTQIKTGVPEKDLIQFSFNSTELKKLVWIKKNEFHLNGRLYDVVNRVFHSDGTITLKCIDDLQEKELFAKLGESTAVNLGNDQYPTPLYFCVKQLFSPILNNLFCGFQFPSSYQESTNHEYYYLSQSYSVFLEEDSPPPCAFS
jgi:hypothetical protein